VVLGSLAIPNTFGLRMLGSLCRGSLTYGTEKLNEVVCRLLDEVRYTVVFLR
jgi:hypothetical protein